MCHLQNVRYMTAITGCFRKDKTTELAGRRVVGRTRGAEGQSGWATEEFPGSEAVLYAPGTGDAGH